MLKRWRRAFCDKYAIKSDRYEARVDLEVRLIEEMVTCTISKLERYRLNIMYFPPKPKTNKQHARKQLSAMEQLPLDLNWKYFLKFEPLSHEVIMQMISSSMAKATTAKIAGSPFVPRTASKNPATTVKKRTQRTRDLQKQKWKKQMDCTEKRKRSVAERERRIRQIEEEGEDEDWKTKANQLLSILDQCHESDEQPARKIRKFARTPESKIAQEPKPWSPSTPESKIPSSIEIEEYVPSEEEEEEDERYRPRAAWVDPSIFEYRLKKQFEFRKVDPKVIFGDFNLQDIQDLTRIFPSQVPHVRAAHRRPRRSSANWEKDKVTHAEAKLYKKQMGYRTPPS
eukprot:TRINITY_DN6119_c0_g1_i1.p1 TRINITY_DN6119_c0_g1~~TRINITY_DN6119_c0_g1_i1.p1  ORF type:complete len:341 (-),score=48.02 TRINITY_DN6119_c0_g1_i1:157-1179(-)